jgi:hypothetical protein
MRCDEVCSWLLMAETPADPLPAVRRHLAGCPACARQQRRLVRLEEAVRAGAAPVDPGRSRQRFLERFMQPGASTPRRALTPRAATWAAAAVLVLGLGWLMWQTADLWLPELPVAERVPPRSGSLAEALPRGGQDVVARLLDHYLRLAGATGAGERWQTMVAIASDLEAEAFRVAHLPQPDELAALVQLYCRVLREGVLDRAAAVPPGPRQVLVPPLRAHLRATATAADRQAAERPAAADALRTLAAAARDAEVQFHHLLAADAGGWEVPARPAPAADAPQALPVFPRTAAVVVVTADELSTEELPVAPRPRYASERLELLAVLVRSGLRLAREDDPLNRAADCSEVAEFLVHVLARAEARGDPELAVQLGQRLAELMDRGVADNLGRVDVAEPDERQVERLEWLGRKLTRTNETLERQLKRAPEAARPGLLKALEASSKGRDKALKAAAKGKGKPEKPSKDKPPPKGKPEFEADKKPPKKKSRSVGQTARGGKAGTAEARGRPLGLRQFWKMFRVQGDAVMKRIVRIGVVVLGAAALGTAFPAEVRAEKPKALDKVINNIILIGGGCCCGGHGGMGPVIGGPGGGNPGGPPVIGGPGGGNPGGPPAHRGPGQGGLGKGKAGGPPALQGKGGPPFGGLPIGGPGGKPGGPPALQSKGGPPFGGLPIGGPGGGPGKGGPPNGVGKPGKKPGK